MRKEKTLEMAVFFSRHSSGTWKEIVKLWNQEFPQWLQTEWRRFALDVKRAYNKAITADWQDTSPLGSSLPSGLVVLKGSLWADATPETQSEFQVGARWIAMTGT